MDNPQSPLHNASLTGESILSHSGEFYPKHTDVIISGRALDFRYVRSYRSSQTESIGLLGRGWRLNYERQIAPSGKDIIYFDGEGRSFLFVKGRGNSFIPPKGMYCELVKEKNQFVQNFRFGSRQVFELPENGGRIITIQDRNENTISFMYFKNEITVTDTLNRMITLHLTNNLITQLEDFTGRIWQYKYNSQNCLVEVVQPGTKDFPKGTSLKYQYDENQRLVALLNARGETVLKNYYDKKTGRVTSQDHGNGTYKLNYKTIKSKGGNIVLETQTILKNGAIQSQLHNENGNEIKRILLVDANSFAPEENVNQKKGLVSIITLSEYNQHGELIKRIFPAGNSTEWIYSTKNASPIDQGNLLQQKNISSVKTDKPLVISYEYNKDFQLIMSETNPKGQKNTYNYDSKGNLINKAFAKVTVQTIDSGAGTKRKKPVVKKLFENYEYNKFGQLTKQVDTDGTVTINCYYPEKDPSGISQKQYTNTKSQGGFLSSVIKDATGLKQINGYRYDIYGNLSVRTDGMGNELVQYFNAMGKVEKVIGRKPDANIVEYHFDEDYNLISETKSFDHYVFNTDKQKLNLTTSKSITNYSYDLLNKLIAREFGSDEKRIKEKYILDENENMIRLIQPMGNITEYTYDERNLIITKTGGVGGKQPSVYKYGYTKNGQLKRLTDPIGNFGVNNFDGYQRAIGFTNPVNTNEKRFLDENGNTQKIQTWGYTGSNGLQAVKKQILLSEKVFHFDEWNRIYKVDEKCFDNKTGKNIGKSNWDGTEGVLSTVIEYGDNNMPVSFWVENNNVLSISYDGLKRRTSIENSKDQKVKFEYDANNNVISSIQTGSVGENAITINNQYDALDRLISQQRNKENARLRKYNSAGEIISTIEKSGIEIIRLHDSLGRSSGKSYRAVSDSKESQIITRSQEYNDNFQLEDFTNADGLQSIYKYDEQGRVIAKTNEGRETFKYTYDQESNLVTVTTPADNKVQHSFDALGRLVTRLFIGKEKQEENFKYDGKNRLVSATNNNSKLDWEYDSLSRVTKQTLNDKPVGFEYNNMGNITGISYPSGKVVEYSYDELGRVTAISEDKKQVVVSYQYNAMGQFAAINYYNGVKANFSYDAQQRLLSIEFIDKANNILLDGCRYEYDAAGRMISEAHLAEGKNKGDRYFYDSANRVVKIQYRVDDLSDANSKYENEVQYEYSKEGLWLNRTTLDANGNIINSEAGDINELNNYSSLGSRAYEYNKEGNCILERRYKKGTDLSNLKDATKKSFKNRNKVLTYWAYEYDGQMRLIKATEYGADNNVILTIEYTYDTQGDLIERKETDSNGVVTDHVFVYANGILIEELTNGVVVNVNIPGPLNKFPVKIDKFDNGKWNSVLPTFDGRHNVKGIIDGLTKEVKEQYGKDLSDHTVYGIDGGAISVNDPVSDLTGDINTRFGGYGNKGGKEMTGSLGRGTSILADALNSMNLDKGKGINKYTGLPHNPGSYSGMRNWELVADNAGETVGSTMKIIGYLVIGVACIPVAVVAVEAALEIVPEAAIAVAIGQVTGMFTFGTVMTVAGEVVSDISHWIGEVFHDTRTKTTTTTTKNDDGSTTTTTTTTTIPDKFSNPDDDSNYSGPSPFSHGEELKAVEAKINANKTPSNPWLSGFNVTADYFTSEEEKRKWKEHTEEDLSGGTTLFDKPREAGNIDFIPDMPPRPTFSPTSGGRGGTDSYQWPRR